MKINRIRHIWKVIEIITGENSPITIKEITKRINREIDDKEHLVTERSVKHYIKSIQDNFSRSYDNPLVAQQGRYGGYQLAEWAKGQLISTSLSAFSTEERNALNDSFESSLSSGSFLYSSDLETARAKFYSDINLKDDDREHYIGSTTKNSKEQLQNMLILKSSSVSDHKVLIKSKYDYHSIKKGTYLFRPLFIIHDSDESFIILKDENSKIHYQNYKNIISVTETDKKFHRHEKEYKKFVNNYTIKAKKKYVITIIPLDERVEKGITLRNMQLEWKKNGHEYEITFYERYIALEFIFVFSNSMEIIKMDDELKKQIAVKQKS
ncbi:MAG: hypothetical protein KAG91_03030, partial [Mycoplasmataceae bacterium]|nr:hypothetical protein [Mycoplasmataceae bacterium]